jgi:hypothetical protein
MRRVLLRALFWLPIVLWLAVEIFLLQVVVLDCGGLSQSCRGGTDCSEIAGWMGLWGLPSSLFPALLAHALPCDTATSIALVLLFCAAGAIQWYCIMRALESLLTKLRLWFRADVGDAAK